MASTVFEIALTPGESINQFVCALTSFMTSPALDQLPTTSGMDLSIEKGADGIVRASMAYLFSQDDIVWSTCVSLVRNDLKATARIDVTPTDLSSDLHHPPKPEILELLLDALGEAGEGLFKNERVAKAIANTKVPQLESLIEGTSTASIPVCYVTSAFASSRNLDINTLAERLYGVAHVIVESNKHVGKKLEKRLRDNHSFSLRSACVLWPAGVKAQSPIMLDEVEEGGEAFCVYLEKKLLSYLPSAVAPEQTNIEIINNENRPDNSQPLRTQIRSSSDDAVNAKVQESTATDVNTECSQCADSSICIGVKFGSEYEFYENEALEMVLDAVQKYVDTAFVSGADKGVQPCRRADVLQAVLDSSSIKVRNVARHREEVRQILTGKRRINQETSSALRKIGVHTEAGGKHPKLKLFGDSRYIVTAASTGSDINGSSNLIADIRRKFF